MMSWGQIVVVGLVKFPGMWLIMMSFIFVHKAIKVKLGLIKVLLYILKVVKMNVACRSHTLPRTCCPWCSTAAQSASSGGKTRSCAVSCSASGVCVGACHLFLAMGGITSLPLLGVPTICLACCIPCVR